MLLYRLKDSTVSVYQNAKKKKQQLLPRRQPPIYLNKYYFFLSFILFKGNIKNGPPERERSREREGEKYEKNHKADALILFVPYK